MHNALKTLATMLSLTLGLTLVLLPAAPARADTHGADSGGDRFIAGGTVSVGEPVKGDLFVTGGSIDVEATVGGDVVLAGGRARLSGDIGQTVYATGGQLTLAGKLGRNLRAAGGRIELAPTSEVEGNVTAAGGQVLLRGRIGGHVKVGGGKVLIDGPIGGDVMVGAGELELGPNARIAGKLRWRGSDQFRQDPQAEVLGGIERLELPTPSRAADETPTESSETPAATVRAGAGWFWTAGLLLLAVLLRAALPRFFGGASERLRERPALGLLAGFVLLVATPVAALVLLFTLIGAPVALLLVAVYLALLPVGYASAGIALGHWVLARWRPAAGRGTQALAVALAMLLVSLAGRMPYLGGWIAFIALLMGLGALSLQVLRQRSDAAAR